MRRCTTVSGGRDCGGCFRRNPYRTEDHSEFIRERAAALM